MKAGKFLQVTIDHQGLIKVTHMMNLQGAQRAPGGMHQGAAAFAETQQANTAHTGVVRFLSAPEELLEEDQ